MMPTPMSTPLASQAQPAVANLLNQDTDQLYAELGKRLHAMRTEPALAGSFAPSLPPQTLMGLAPSDALRTFGKTFFDRLNVQAYDLVCGTNADATQQRENIFTAFTSGTAGVGGVLAALLVSQLGLAPAIAGVVAALVIKLFFKPAYDAMCAAWKEGLPQTNQTASGSTPGQPAGAGG